MEVEIDQDNVVVTDEIRPLNLNAFKRIQPDDLKVSVFAAGLGILQRTYYYDHGYLAELTIRRSIGMPRAGSNLDLMWLRGSDDSGGTVYIGIDSEYVFERTGMLTSPAIAAESNQTTVPILDVLTAVVFQLEPILGIQTETLLGEAEVLANLPGTPMTDYMVLDHRRRSKLVFYAERRMLDSMEANARNYCTDYWRRHSEFSALIKHPVSLGLFPSKRLWDKSEYDQIQQGDLLALQGLRTDANHYRLRGYLCLLNHKASNYKYEVQFNMEEQSVEVEFTGESIADPQQPVINLDVPPHEQIELDIVAGRTTIPLGELCAVQPGTLIELGRHGLPMVSLCVNGEAVLEGELVHFKDQIMVQVTKRLA